ncbi:MAG: bacterial Ig-like domain-containing protein [Lachnospiraceae bacterium]|nr:bacterial Ig-like domain-containing protein [Lachnospiraceae bacterium]
MFNLKRALAGTLAAMLCFTTNTLTSFATEVTPTATSTFVAYNEHPSANDIKNRPDASLNLNLFKANYTKQMSSQNAIQGYLINAQPSDAILFNSTSNMAVVCEATPTGVDQSNPRGVNQISVNYETGLLDLPRLTAQYYYNILQVGSSLVNAEEEGSYGFSVKRTLYPSLSWVNTVPEGTEVILGICSADTNTVLRQVTVKFATQQEGLKSGWKDCSSYVLQDVLDPDYNAIYRTEAITWYPAELHRSCIVTSNFIVGHNDIWGAGGDSGNRNTFGFFLKTFNTSSGKNTTLPEYFLGNRIVNYTYFQNKATTTSVKDLVYPYINGSSKPEYFAVFMPHGQGVTYNSNKGIVTTGANNSVQVQYAVQGSAADYKGVYAVCTGTDFNVYTVAPTAYSGDLTQIDENGLAKTYDNGTSYNIEEDFGRYGFKVWADEYAGQGFDVQDYPSIKYNGAERKTFNVYNSAMAFGGLIPHVARLTAMAPVQHYTVTTWYKLPDTTSSQLLKCEELSIALDGTAPSLKTPTQYVAMYTFDRWYTDQACTVPADMNTIHQNAKADDAIQLYGKYNYTGGTYTVQFYNDATGESSSQTFECREQPTLPTTPTRSGYLFRNWQIVYNTASTTGTPYDPQTFAPSKDTNYLFKTFWDVEGVIQSVTTNQNEYYVGDSIDKSKVVVTVQTDNTGTTRTLNTDEFTVSPDKVNSTGRNQIQVTYNATGATATFDVNGRAVQPVSLTARYTGSALNVGATVSRSNITCTVNYNNGTSEDVTDFTIAPTTIANAGANTIRVIYGSLSTSVTVTGNRAQTTPSGGSSTIPRPTSGPTGGTTTRPNTTGSPSGTSGTNGTGNNRGQAGSSRLKSISAVYAGAQPYVGDVLKANDITVTAAYQDGSTTTLSSTAFQFSPSYVRNSGENTITVSYGGLTTSFTVSALLKSDTAVDNTELLNQQPTIGGIIGVDDNGNIIYDDGTNSMNNIASSGGGTYTGSAGSPDRVTLGNPLTGAGMPGDNKGTSKGYLNGSNILTSRLYGGTTSIANTLDILSEINAAGDTASSVDIELYNGAADNDITVAMLQALKDKDLTLNIRMLNPDDKSTQVGYWSIMGGALTGDDKQFSPNISFEVTDKGAETLTYMAIADGDYPNGASLQVMPALSTYDAGELIRIYSCGFDKSDAHLESVFTWNETGNTLAFDFTHSKRYALSNAADAYEEGSSLTMDISRPSEADELESDGTGDTDEEELGDDFWNSDGSEDSSDENVSVPTVPKKGINIGTILLAILAVVMVVGVVVCLLLLARRRKLAASASLDEGFDDYETVGDGNEEYAEEDYYADGNEPYSEGFDEDEDFSDSENEEEP